MIVIPRRTMLGGSSSLRGPETLMRARLVLPLAPSRAYSSVSSKITAVPFAQTPEQARERLLVHGLLASAQMSNVVMAGILRIFGRAFEPLCREFGLGESLVLRDMRPAYYPIWRVDVIAEGPVSPAKGGEETHGWMAVREGYLPGNAFAPLSYISYAVPPLENNLPTYNPSKHLRQLDGINITEVPFNVSPFAMIDKIRRKIGITNVDGLRINQAKWEETMVAAYPIMFPIYIAEFEHKPDDGDARRYSVIMDAHEDNTSDCRVTFPPPEEMRESGRLAKNYYVNPAPFLPSANLIVPLVPHAINAQDPAPPAAVMAKAYQQWMSPEPTGSSVPASPTYSIAGEPIDWSDPRIITWGSVDHELNGDYMEKGLEVNRNIEAVRTIDELSHAIPDDATVTVGKLERGHLPSFSKEPLSNVHSQMWENIEKEKIELEAIKPQWLKDYHASMAAAAAEAKAEAERVEAAKREAAANAASAERQRNGNGNGKSNGDEKPAEEVSEKSKTE